MLIIKKLDDNGWYELSSYTSQWQIFLTPEQKAKKLLEYQKEMTAFGHFLKQKFLNANESPKQTSGKRTILPKKSHRKHRALILAS